MANSPYIALRTSLGTLLPGFLLLGLFPSLCTAKPPSEISSASSSPAVPPAEHLEFFEKEIRPLLVQHCHECHGADTQEGDLRLDIAAGLQTGGYSGPPIAPGNPENSLLIEVIHYGPDSYQMPPGGKLPDEAIAALTKWVQLGAPWPAEAEPEHTSKRAEFNLAERAEYWSFQPLHQPALPEVSSPAWCLNPIDRFILAGLDTAGLSPAPAADKRTWLRRVTFDLIGLPPTPTELTDFLADDSDTAYQRVVDRLLDSEHYGERWGRHWLDLARYAETYGHEFDYTIPEAWRYRDYVIRALNADVPYNQFLTEHLAGDLLLEPRRHPTEGFNESIIGTGFFLLGEAVHSPVDIRGDEADRVDNQIEVFTKTFLGLTVSCARCHDHKFDPITTADYYALAGYLQSSRDQLAYIDDPATNREVLEQLSQLRATESHELASLTAAALAPGLRQLARDVELAQATSSADGGGPTALSAVAAPTAQQLLASLEQRLAARHVVAPQATLEATSELRAGTEPILIEDFNGPDYAPWFVTGEAFGSKPRPAGEPIPRAAHSLPEIVPSGLADSGRYSVRAEGVLRSPTYEVVRHRLWTRIRGRGTVSFVIDSHRLINGPLHQTLRQSIDTGGQWKWISHDLTIYQGHRGFIELIDSGDEALAVDRIFFANTTEPDDAWLGWSLARNDVKAPPHSQLAVIPSSEAFLPALERWSARAPTTQSLSLIDSLLVSLAAEQAIALGLAEHLPAALAAHEESLAKLSTEIQQAEQRLTPSRRALAFAEGTPENERIHLRGNHKKLGDVVPRRTLEIFGGLENPANDRSSGRLELAHHLTDPTHPLVARVMVNRLWHHHFGRGLVASTDNFGLLGDEPTHSELLDWLATEFIVGGWSLKQMHRLMVLSQTYRMSGETAPAALAHDPANRSWHHMPVRRLEGEIVRDSVLAVAGTLDTQLYGPSVMPHLSPFMQGRGRPAESGPLDGDRRRSIYIGVRRNFLTPLFTAFDYPPPYTSTGRRTVSHVPAQALLLMNNPLIQQQAQNWAARVLEQQSSPDARVEQLYREAFCREPTTTELQQATQFIDTQLAQYAEQAPAAAEQQAWTDLCHVIFNLKEFIFIR